MTQEIYFDGNLMDIDESTKIVLQIKSNLFTEITKCVGNRTYTVQLPKTARNLHILEYANQPASTSTIPYRYIPARYVRNGIEIFTDAYAYIISCKEKIEVCIVWGVPAILRSIFTDGMKLNEITDDGRSATYVRYNQVNTYNQLSNLVAQGWCYAAIDYLAYDNVSQANNIYTTQAAIGRMPLMGYLRPCIFLHYILNRLWNLYRIDFSLDSDVSDWLRNIIFPCVTDEADQAMTARSYVLNGRWWEVDQRSASVFPDSINYDAAPTPVVLPACRVVMSINYVITYHTTCSESQLRTIINNKRIGAIVTVDDNIIKEYTPAISVNVVDDGGNPWSPDGTGDRTDTWHITTDGLLTNVEAEAKDRVFVYFMHNGYKLLTFPDNELEGGTIYFVPTIKNALYGVGFPLTKNFPDMKVTEFLQWVAAITGTFPRQTSGGTSLEFVHYSSIFNNKANAVDWSSKLVRAYDDNAPRELGFTVDGWSQVNNYQYKENKDKGTFADGQIILDNVQLDSEQDVVGDAFEAAKPANNVPIYKVDADADAQRLLQYLFPSEDETSDPLDADSADPYVLYARPLEVNGVEYISGQFDPSLYWSNILSSDRYKGLISSLRKVKVLHETFALTDSDIKTFDETIPVYLAQYGHYYAVTEIKSSETGVCDVTLFQLEL